MKIVGRILSCLCAFLLAVAVLGSQLVIFANHAVQSQSFYIRPGESIRKDQLGEMQQLLDTLAETYGFVGRAGVPGPDGTGSVENRS